MIPDANETHERPQSPAPRSRCVPVTAQEPWPAVTVSRSALASRNRKRDYSAPTPSPPLRDRDETVRRVMSWDAAGRAWSDRAEDFAYLMEPFTRAVIDVLTQELCRFWAAASRHRLWVRLRGDGRRPTRRRGERSRRGRRTDGHCPIANALRRLPRGRHERLAVRRRLVRCRHDSCRHRGRPRRRRSGSVSGLRSERRRGCWHIRSDDLFR
jgi:hypothetical protein